MLSAALISRRCKHVGVTTSRLHLPPPSLSGESVYMSSTTTVTRRGGVEGQMMSSVQKAAESSCSWYIHCEPSGAGQARFLHANATKL